MSAPPYMKLYIADYHAETTTLDVVGHGAYMLLLMAMWRAGGKLPRDEVKLAKLAKCSADQWAAVREDVLEHFTVNGGSITHGRVRKEIAKYKNVVSGSKKAAEASAAKRANKINVQAPANGSAFVEGTLSQPEPEPEPEGRLEAKASLSSTEDAQAELKAKKPRKVTSYPDAFEAVWQTYPDDKKRSSKPKALEQWKALPEAERGGLLLAIARFRPNVEETCGGKGAPALDRWLKDGKHLNWMQAAAEAPVAEPEYACPKPIWDALVKATNPGFAASYLAQCAWSGDDEQDRTLTPATSAAFDKLKSVDGFVDWLAARRVRLINPKTNTPASRDAA